MKNKNDVLILMGIKHCGKSTQGKLLSAKFSCAFFDTDDVIFEMTGKSPRDIYSQKGKEAFFQAEEEACRSLPAKIHGKAVIATGGGICNNQGALDVLRNLGTLIFLNSDETTACDRIIKEIVIEQDGILQNLPAYISKENPKTLDDVRNIFHQFYTERQKLYKSICDVEVILKPVSKQENTLLILKAVGIN